MTLSEVAMETPLIMAVKVGHYEIVDWLAQCNDCDVNKPDKYQLSPVDYALVAWYAALVDGKDRALIRQRGRILRSLLLAGANTLNVKHFNHAMVRCHHIEKTFRVMQQLTRIVCDYRLCTSDDIKTRLMQAILPYNGFCPLMEQLLVSGAHVDTDMFPSQLVIGLPVENAIILSQSSNNIDVLSVIEDMVLCDGQTQKFCSLDLYQKLVRILVYTGYSLHLATLNSFRCGHARLYNWIYNTTSSPFELKALCRIALRRHSLLNVFYSVNRARMPNSVKCYVLMTQVWESHEIIGYGPGLWSIRRCLCA